ncbi:Potassium transporter 7 [Platanthera guangdongensis]|uniref:Potassium transporter 7 n=1 Tax=Platanthera guangdongensis TaxID=2320717 RepID=A0ABR2MA81_9ASPA
MSEGSERDNGGLVKMDSTESRWVFQDDDDTHSEIQSSYESEEEGNGVQRLIRTGPRMDSFDVEALEVLSAQRHGVEDFNLVRSLVLVLQTLGVVFGDVGTSLLYTFDIMFNKYPISQKEDVLGALSLVLYTLILIALVKYTLIVLWGNDDGEGNVQM